MRTKALTAGSLSLVLGALTRENRLVCLVALQTGLRVSDVLNLRSDALRQSKMTIKESKTGKKKQIRLPVWLRDELIKIAGKIYVFEGRNDYTKHRSRQAVWRDVHRCAEFFGRKKVEGIGSHTMRKCYAVDLRKQGLSPAQIQRALNHSDPTITALYAIADVIELSK